MPEDPIAHGEIAALTRHILDTEAQNAREFGIVKSELTTLQLKVSNLDLKVDRLEQKVDGISGKVDGLSDKLDAFITEQQRSNATLVELLSNLVGKDPNAT